MIVLEYEKRFQNLSIFAFAYLPIKRHQIQRFYDRLILELKTVLTAMQFQTVQELVQAVQAIKRVVQDDQRQGNEQGQITRAKRKEIILSTNRPPVLKKEERWTVIWEVSEGRKELYSRQEFMRIYVNECWRILQWPGLYRANVVVQFIEQWGPIYPLYTR